MKNYSYIITIVVKLNSNMSKVLFKLYKNFTKV